MLNTTLSLKSPVRGIVKSNETYAVSTWYAVQYLAAFWTQKLAQKVTVATTEDSYLLRTLTRTVLGPIPLRLFCGADAYAPRTVIASYTCNMCGMQAPASGFACNCEGTWETRLTMLSAPQWLAYALAQPDGDAASQAERTFNTMKANSPEFALSYVMRVLQEDLGRIQLQLGAGEKKMASAGIDISRVRVMPGINPAFMGKGIHPAVASVTTTCHIAPEAAKMTNTLEWVTSSSRPGEILHTRGEEFANILEHTVPFLAYIEPSRHSISAGAIARAITLKNPETPCVRPLKATVGPDSFNAWTAFIDIPEVAGDMIVISDELASSVQFDDVRRFQILPGSEVHVVHGATIPTREGFMLATSPEGHQVEFHTIESNTVSCTITVSGETSIIDGRTIMEELGLITVTIARTLGVGNKLVTPYSDKGLCDGSRDLVMQTSFGGKDIAINAVISPSRCSAGKMKTGANVLHAAISLTTYLRYWRGDAAIPESLVSQDMTVEEALEALRAELIVTLADYQELPSDLVETSYKLQLIQDLHDAVEPSIASMTPAEREEALQEAYLDLVMVPMHHKQGDTWEYIGEGMLSYHPFLVQPQMPSQLTGTPPVVCDQDLTREDEYTLNLRHTSSRSGSPALYTFESAFLEHNAPELHAFLFKGHRDPAKEWLANQLIACMTQQGTVRAL